MRTERKTVYKLTECAILLALGVVLSMIKLADMPYGGSVTVASTLPVALISYRYGFGYGILSALAYSIVQQLLGLNTLTYVSGAVSLIAVILLDYIVAYAVIGLAGIFRNKIENKGLSMAAGILFVCILRYICHVISGCTVWAGISIPTTEAFIYSLAYNATYMIPETIITVMAAYYLCSSIDFTKETPKRVVRTANAQAELIRLAGTGVLLGGLAFVIAKIFAVLQSEDTGEFDFTNLTSMPSKTVVTLCVVSAVAAGTFLFTSVISSRIGKENGKKNS